MIKVFSIYTTSDKVTKTMTSLNARWLVKEASLKRQHIIGFQLQDILESAKVKR